MSRAIVRPLMGAADVAPKQGHGAWSPWVTRATTNTVNAAISAHAT
jgi:hypothetical protein